MMEDQNNRAETWTHEETALEICEMISTNNMENTPRRNLEVFQRICSDMKDLILNVSGSSDDCRARIKRLENKVFPSKKTE